MVGGLVGMNHDGTVSKCHSRGSVTGRHGVGGVVGRNDGAVHNCYSSSSVVGEGNVGGLVGYQWYRTVVTNSYSNGAVVGKDAVGGLMGFNLGIVSNSFWDVEASGMEESDGGTGKTTAEMRDIATFIAAAWDITAVASGETNTAYAWNIVDGQTYPFLSWQPVL